MQFTSDGALAVPKQVKRDHCTVFCLIQELDFPVGKKFLIQLLRGEMNERVRKFRFDKKIYFGNLGGYTVEELDVFLEVLLTDDYLMITLQKNKYPVLMLTKKGEEELLNPKKAYVADRVEKTTSPKKEHVYTITPVSEQEKKAMERYNDFLQRFTDEQKQAIVSLAPKQLCIAGAGSGKTSVLTTKIAHLILHEKVNPLDILAITFTRKAKREMQERLAELLPGTRIRIETFNSFAEKELLAKGMQYYGREKRMATQKEFVSLVLQGISQLGFSLDAFMEHYFTTRERRGKEPRDMFFSFLYDFRVILDAYTQAEKGIASFQEIIRSAAVAERLTAMNVVKLASVVHELLHAQGLRTYSDQLIDVTRMYVKHPKLARHYAWVLVDEYQDVNPLQTELIDLLTPEHVFAVGDPRQSIYAWRGSDPEQIYSFITDETSVFELTTNFRSTESVVNIANAIIAGAYKGHNSFAALRAHQTRQGFVSLMKFATEETEAIAIMSQIKELAVKRNEVFILSRTNKGLERIAEQLRREHIPFVLRTEEKAGSKKLQATEDQIVLSTVHAAKGLEAEIVFVVGVTMNMYPCKAKDHKYVTLLTGKASYDTYEEERRIFYVACTRAKKELRLSYYGAASPFLGPKVTDHCTHQVAEKQTRIFGSGVDNQKIVDNQRVQLRRWRYLEAQERGVPPYMIFSDKALEHLLELQPLTLDELEEVSGFGKTKIREFGRDLLHVMYR
jgi:superfamily I DNA/RNA helicase